MSDPVIDRIDAVHLEGLRYHAIGMQRTAHSVEHYAKAVVFKRPFETMAEDELEKAELALAHALQVVKTARAEYAAKQPMTFAEAAE